MPDIVPELSPAFLDDSAIQSIFRTPRAVDSFKAIQDLALSVLPAGVNTAGAQAQSAQSAADGAQSTADTIASAAIVVLALSGALSNERVLTGGTGVTLDIATANLVKIVVNVLAILNTAPVVITQPVTVSALECNTLRVDITPTASATATDHSIPISCNGTTYYMRLSTAP